jgi:Tfp pilus assembly protein PilF
VSSFDPRDVADADVRLEEIAGERLAETLRRARKLAATGEDEAARHGYLDVLRIDPAHFSALNELGVLALAGGYSSASRTAWSQAVHFHPGNAIARVNLGNLLLEDGDADAARPHFEAALAAVAGSPEAHQGLARALTELGDVAAAEPHWIRGFAGHAIVIKPYRGKGTGARLLLVVAARGGNIPTRHWIDDRHFAVTAVYADFHDLACALPPHDVAVNAIGDADLCDDALANAETMLAGGAVPIINPPARVRATGRATIARRLAGIPDVVTPAITRLSRASAPATRDLTFPLLLRAPGFHTGRHFTYVENAAVFAPAAAAMPGDEIFAIEYLDARGQDGMARKCRVMLIDGELYPLHLAIAADWKVHYFSAEMAANAAYREEERRFLNDMPAVMGSRAMAALTVIGRTLDLDYAGVDFALAPDGSLLVFEANATMVINPPGPEPMWDYRRPAIDHALAAARRLLERRAEASPAVPAAVGA